MFLLFSYIYIFRKILKYLKFKAYSSYSINQACYILLQILDMHADVGNLDKNTETLRLGIILTDVTFHIKRD